MPLLRSATTVLEAVKTDPSRRRRRSVPRQMPWVRSLGGNLVGQRGELVIERLREPQQRQLVPGEADRAQERVVGVLDRAVRARYQDQVAGLFGRRAEQAGERVGPLQLVALHDEPERSRPSPPTVAIPVSSARNVATSGAEEFNGSAK